MAILPIKIEPDLLEKLRTGLNNWVETHKYKGDVPQKIKDMTTIEVQAESISRRLSSTSLLISLPTSVRIFTVHIKEFTGNCGMVSIQSPSCISPTNKELNKFCFDVMMSYLWAWNYSVVIASDGSSSVWRVRDWLFAQSDGWHTVKIGKNNRMHGSEIQMFHHRIEEPKIKYFERAVS